MFLKTEAAFSSTDVLRFFVKCNGGTETTDKTREHACFYHVLLPLKFFGVRNRLPTVKHSDNNNGTPS